MKLTDLPPADVSARPCLNVALESINRILLGKDRVVRLALTCLLARGHLLLEDLPGMGKTVLAHTLGKVMGLGFTRVQFTNDMLPADLTGGAVFDRDRGEFVFHPGPLFTQLLLADEINRASPKTQSALLEAMEEQQVSCDGVTHPLPRPFFVIATQNPVDQLSTNPLPEAQLDRFLMRLSLGYPDGAAELDILRGANRRHLISELSPALDAPGLMALQAAADSVHVSDALLNYILALVHHTRADARAGWGLSPRGGLALLAAARAWAFLDGRGHVLPADVHAVFAATVVHRLGLADAPHAQAAADGILREVSLP